MRRKLFIWLITMATATYVFPFALCGTSVLTGALYAFKPCDVFNCQDPAYFDPCAIVNCNEGTRSVPILNGDDSTTGTTSTTTDQTSTLQSLLGR